MLKRPVMEKEALMKNTKTINILVNIQYNNTD